MQNGGDECDRAMHGNDSGEEAKIIGEAGSGVRWWNWL